MCSSCSSTIEYKAYNQIRKPLLTRILQAHSPGPMSNKPSRVMQEDVYDVSPPHRTTPPKQLQRYEKFNQNFLRYGFMKCFKGIYSPRDNFLGTVRNKWIWRQLQFNKYGWNSFVSYSPLNKHSWRVKYLKFSTSSSSSYLSFHYLTSSKSFLSDSFNFQRHQNMQRTCVGWVLIHYRLWFYSNNFIDTNKHLNWSKLMRQYFICSYVSLYKQALM